MLPGFAPQPDTTILSEKKYLATGNKRETKPESCTERGEAENGAIT
jgi:hypothetical protein